MEPIWITWAKKLQAIAQIGLVYTDNPFDRDRLEQVRKIAVEMGAWGAQMPGEQVYDLFAREKGYATPKVDVRGVAFRGEEVLLVQERQDRCWTLPGGWADVGESPAEATEREVFEEAGYVVRATKLLALLDRSRHPHPPHPYHIYKVFFLCELVGGEPTESMETAGVGFFPRHDLPPLSLSRTVPQQIERFFQHREHPEWPTDFD